MQRLVAGDVHQMRAHVARRERHRSADRTGRSGGVEKDPAPVREVPQGAGVRDVDGDRCPRTAEVADLPAAVGRALETMPDAEALPGVWASQRTDPGLLLSGVVAPEVPWDEAMAALDVPALLLTGDRPGSARVGREGLETAARNPRISPVLVPGAGHQVRRSDPEAFYRAVDEWLSEVLPVG